MIQIAGKPEPGLLEVSLRGRSVMLCDCNRGIRMVWPDSTLRLAQKSELSAEQHGD